MPAALLAAAVRGGEVDPVGEERAVAAFRAARDEGALAVRGTRRRDDWRPARERRRRRSLRAAAMGLAATVLLGGVAVAAQSGAIRSPFGGGNGGGDGGGAVPKPGVSTAATPSRAVPAAPLAERPRGKQHRPTARPTHSVRPSDTGTKTVGRPEGKPTPNTPNTPKQGPKSGGRKAGTAGGSGAPGAKRGAEPGAGGNSGTGAGGGAATGAGTGGHAGTGRMTPGPKTGNAGMNPPHTNGNGDGKAEATAR
ncbi:hypothetical protein QWM81_18055 [Streptomyces ficellus]|uniref:Translation initiation factor IF-2 n=1 Tax=Streptomyces ficellus TaxID=1977088 RepID=A0ABT7Z8Y7_9ACTN|nr:hypothetical protein [Streptomyces ficellus]MDN3295921.1 hypothetical protein [Streptomyces ficellus]